MTKVNNERMKDIDSILGSPLSMEEETTNINRAEEEQPRVQKKPDNKKKTTYIGFRLEESVFAKLNTIKEKTEVETSELVRQAIIASIKKYESINGEIVPTYREKREKKKTLIFD